MLEQKHMSAVEWTQECITRMRRKESEIGALLATDFDAALQRAASIDKRRLRGDALGALAGIPYIAKDNICTRGLATTAGSRMLEGHLPLYDAAAVERLRAEDALLLAKGNMDEFAMGSSTEHSAFRLTRNPLDATRVPGGSSGGSAAAVCAGYVPFALGSDTGGSVRQPAAYCGLVGVKPCYGSVSRYGLIAFASSLDQIGVLAGDVRDAAEVLRVIAKRDARDATCHGALVEPLPEEPRSLHDVTFCVPEGLAATQVQPEILHSFQEALARIQQNGAHVECVRHPDWQQVLAAYCLLSSAECCSNLARYDGIRYGACAQGDTLEEQYQNTRSQGFGKEVKRRILLGNYVLRAEHFEQYYQKAAAMRNRLRVEYEKWFERADALLLPTTMQTAFRFGEKDEPMRMYETDLFTIPANLTGHCALSMPCGRDHAGLPIGLQIVARDENTLLRIALAVEASGGTT